MVSHVRSKVFILTGDTKNILTMQKTATIFLALMACTCCWAADDTNVVSLGNWSEPVSNEYGCKLRGRLLMCAYPDHRGPANRVDLGVYVELQEYSDSFAGAVHVYTDFAKGLKCEVADANGKPPEPVGTGYDGGIPGPQWISLPPFASTRLRANVYAGGRLRDGGLGLWFAGAGDWTIKPTDTNTYFLSATLTIVPPAGTNDFSPSQVWSGVLQFPKIKLPHAGRATP
jgi:hypothetical protein